MGVQYIFVLDAFHVVYSLIYLPLGLLSFKILVFKLLMPIIPIPKVLILKILFPL